MAPASIYLGHIVFALSICLSEKNFVHYFTLSYLTYVFLVVRPFHWYQGQSHLSRSNIQLHISKNGHMGALLFYKHCLLLLLIPLSFSFVSRSRSSLNIKVRCQLTIFQNLAIARAFENT